MSKEVTESYKSRTYEMVKILPMNSHECIFIVKDMRDTVLDWKEIRGRRLKEIVALTAPLQYDYNGGL